MIKSDYYKVNQKQKITKRRVFLLKYDLHVFNGKPNTLLVELTP